MKIVPLTSRKGLCVHESVSKANDVTQKCEDLTEKGQCPHNDQQMVSMLASNITSSIQDIEEIGTLAHQMQVCGYFGCREASQDADIVVTPYQSILSASAREALGISLLNKILVFDEAHNIMETMSSINTVQLTYSNLMHAYN